VPSGETSQRIRDALRVIALLVSSHCINRPGAIASARGASSTRLMTTSASSSCWLHPTAARPT